MDLPDWKTGILIFIGIALITWLAINMTIQPIYDLGACTINKFNCTAPEVPGWDGICTQEIKDDCCDPVRVCGGITTNPNDCYTQYCWEEGKMCVPVYREGTGDYECKCTSAYL